MSVAGDTILSQVEHTYDAGGNVIATVSRERYHNAAASQTGELENPTETPKARVTYAASYPDALGRFVAAADYGTNGGTALVRSSTIPERSDTVLVSSAEFDSAGNAFETVDPLGIVSRSEFDDAGRQTRQIANYQSDSSSSSSSGNCDPSDDVNVTVETAYNADGNVSSITAKNTSTGDQKTEYIYGTTLTDSEIASSLLKRSEVYPDSVDGSDRITFEYNRQSQVTKVTDQGGTVHEYDFDKLGRQIHDRVTTLGTGVDGAVRRISTEYEVRGMQSSVASWNNASVTSGNIVNEVEFSYNDFAQLTHDYQSHSGAVNVLMTPKVQYGYANGSANTIRPTTVTYPDGRVLTYDYGAADSMADALSRIAAIVDDDVSSTHLVDYEYLGLSAFVEADYTEPEIRYTLVGTAGGNDPDTGDIYRGLDRFGRIVDSYWYDDGSSADLDRIQYGYNRGGNRIWRENVVAASQGKEFDELYTCDGIQRLKDMARGTLNSEHTALTSTTFAECWGLDETGNWRNFRQDDNGNGTWNLNQDRTANKVNEITDITESAGPSWVTPAYSKPGNMTTVPQPADPTASYTATYGAWNRLVKLVDTNSSDTVAEYEYDGAKRRVIQKSYVSGTLDETRHLLFTAQWQVAEERINSDTDPDRQHVWGLRYIDDLVLRDRDTTGDGTLDERLYALQDANWNVTSITNGTGTVQQRFGYSPYGVPEFLTSAFAGSTNTKNFETLYAGYRWEDATNLYHVRNRVYNPKLGTWIQRDPMATVHYSDNVMAYISRSLLVATDPAGLHECLNVQGKIVTSTSRGSLTSATIGTYDPIPGESSRIGSTASFQYKFTLGAFLDDKGCCCCDKIGFVQIAKTVRTYTNGWGKADPWEIDGSIPYAFPRGSTAKSPCPMKGDIPADRKSLFMTDSPNAAQWYRPYGIFPITASLDLLDQEFETCVMCLSGIEFSKDPFGFAVYGCFRWSHHIALTKSGYKYSRYVGTASDTSLGDTASLDLRNITLSRPSAQFVNLVRASLGG